MSSKPVDDFGAGALWRDGAGRGAGRLRSGDQHRGTHQRSGSEPTRRARVSLEQRRAVLFGHSRHGGRIFQSIQ